MNIPTAAVWYIIKKASANFGKRTVLYRVPRMGNWQIKEMHLFCSTLLCMKRMSVGVYETDELLDCGLQV